MLNLLQFSHPFYIPNHLLRKKRSLSKKHIKNTPNKNNFLYHLYYQEIVQNPPKHG